MALSEMDLSRGIRGLLKNHDAYFAAKKPEPKLLYSQKEIAQMMLTTPLDLEKRGRVDTPIGTWHIEGGITIFDIKPKDEIDKITRTGVRKRMSALAKTIFQMS